ncbi:hypothetical protein FHX80_112120 [Streptomyces brevispora]|uniref:Aminoacyl-tRNA editing protein n=1 Tax=Streptomyces brevispora TaxID=887462 RepID=A0A561UWF5_9ACTN|nr:hypothetical protein FHX80_112120 [Streptomyces brevispora]
MSSSGTGTDTDADAPTGSDSAAAHPRFADALRESGLDVETRRFPAATRAAAEAAAALGCALSEIVKSLIFEADGVPVLVRHPRTPSRMRTTS